MKSPLHYAAMQGSGIEGFSGIRNKDYSKALELLIFNGADIISEGRFKKTALMLAMERNNKDIVDLLRKHGAKE